MRILGVVILILVFIQTVLIHLKLEFSEEPCVKEASSASPSKRCIDNLCLLCEYKHTPSFKDYFNHIGQHLLLFNALCICIFTTSSQCKIFFFRGLFSVSLSYRLMPNFCASQPYLYNRDLWPLWTDRALSFSRLLGAKLESSNAIKVMDQVLVACKQNCLWQSI